MRAGEEETKKDNLIVWSSRTSYDFRAKEQDREPWADMSHSLRLKPGRFLSSDFSLTHDLDRWSRSRLSLRTSLRTQGGEAGAGQSGDQHGGFGDPGGEGGAQPGNQQASSLTGPWRFNATHIFSMGRESDSQRSSLNFSSEMSLTSGWRLNYSVYYDLSDREVTSQGFTLNRDLHCWQAVLERRSSGGRSSYFFRIAVKELPDLKYERHRS